MSKCRCRVGENGWELCARHLKAQRVQYARAERWEPRDIFRTVRSYAREANEVGWINCVAVGIKATHHIEHAPRVDAYRVGAMVFFSPPVGV